MICNRLLGGIITETQKDQNYWKTGFKTESLWSWSHYFVFTALQHFILKTFHLSLWFGFAALKFIGHSLWLDAEVIRLQYPHAFLSRRGGAVVAGGGRMAAVWPMGTELRKAQRTLMWVQRKNWSQTSMFDVFDCKLIFICVCVFVCVCVCVCVVCVCRRPHPCLMPQSLHRSTPHRKSSSPWTRGKQHTHTLICLINQHIFGVQMTTKKTWTTVMLWILDPDDTIVTLMS